MFILITLYRSQSDGSAAISCTGPRHASKPHSTFSSFYPFYLREHAHPTTKLYHAVGTTLVILVVLFRQPWSILSGTLALAVGYVLCDVLQGLSHGFYEFVAMIIVFGLSNCITMHSMGLLPLFIGYGMAWYSHRFIERNQPATFTYPAYSLLGDFCMWYGVVTGKFEVTI